MLRIDASKFGASRQAVLKALQAEGIPCSAGYGYSLPQQPMFRKKAFGPYIPTAAANLDFNRVHCPNSDLICREQGMWIEQSVLLGPKTDMDDIIRAFEKIYEHRQALRQFDQKN
jgi:perosamine synthetase